MNVLLVANYAPDRQHSMLRFSEMLERGLAERGMNVRVVHPPAVFSGWVGARSRLHKWLGYADKFLVFPRALRREAGWADVVHICDHSNAVYVDEVGAKPSVVTCHDLLAVRSARGDFPENATAFTGRIYQRWILRGLQRSPNIVCVSEATRADVLRFVGSDPARVRVVPNGLNYPYSRMSRGDAERALAERGVGSGELLLHVGGNQWYKNRLGVLRIFAELAKIPPTAGLRLVLAGHPQTAEMRAYAREAGIADRVVELVDPDNETLRALYSTAAGLLFPSLHEGFGWPIVEAHACGCPVFATARAPLTEVGGDCAIYVDPGDPRAAAARIARALAAGEGRGAAAVANAARFTTRKMVDGYVALYAALSAAGEARDAAAEEVNA